MLLRHSINFDHCGGDHYNIQKGIVMKHINLESIDQYELVGFRTHYGFCYLAFAKMGWMARVGHLALTSNGFSSIFDGGYGSIDSDWEIVHFVGKQHVDETIGWSVYCNGEANRFDMEMPTADASDYAELSLADLKLSLFYRLAAISYVESPQGIFKPKQIAWFKEFERRFRSMWGQGADTNLWPGSIGDRGPTSRTMDILSDASRGLDYSMGDFREE